MLCRKCSAENPEVAKFCSECASPMAAKCPRCGASSKPGAKFCNECAAPLAGGSPKSATQPAATSSVRAIESPEPEKLEGERKTVTALFADIRCSTELEQDLDPEEARVGGCWIEPSDQVEVHRMLSGWSEVAVTLLALVFVLDVAAAFVVPHDWLLHYWFIFLTVALITFGVMMRINSEEWMREHPQELEQILERHRRHLESNILEDTVKLSQLRGWRASLARWNRYPKLIRALDKYAQLRGWRAEVREKSPAEGRPPGGASKE